MKRYTMNLRLPKILLLNTLPGCSRIEEDRMRKREIFLHTPTGGLVEIFTRDEYFIEEKYMQISFCEKKPESGIYKYTAVLLNKPQNISHEDGMMALQDVSKWYKRHDDEFTSLNSLKWVDYPDWLEIN